MIAGSGADSTRATWLAVAAGAAAAVWIVLLTASALGRGPDSIAYIGAADNIAGGRGITLPFVPGNTDVAPTEAAAYAGRAPLYQYSPLVPVLLAGPIALGLDRFDAARLLNIVTAALAAAMVAWATARLTRGSYLATGVAVFVLVTSAVYVIAYTFVSSESVFVVLVMAALGALASDLSSPSWPKALAFAALAGAATLARYSGASVVVTGAMAILLWSPSPVGARWRRALAVGSVALAPAGAWSVVELGRGGGGAGPGFHPPDALPDAGQAVSSWLHGELIVSWSEPTTIRVLGLVAVLAAVAAWAHHRTRVHAGAPEPGPRALWRVGWLFVAVYVVLLWATITFLVASTGFGTKYLLPVLPPLLVLTVATGWRLVTGAVTPVGRTLAAVAVLAATTLVVVWHVDTARATWSSARGLKIASSRGHPESVFAALRALPRGTVVFGNEPEAVYHETDGFGVSLPAVRSPWTGELNGRYVADLMQVGPALCRHPGVAAITGLGPSGGPLAEELARAAHLQRSGQYPDGVILRTAPGSCARAKGARG